MQIESRRLQNPQYIVMAEAAAAVTDGTLRVIQFDRPPTNDAVLEQIDDLCIQFGDALEVRFYGWGFESFDARIVGRMPNVGSLSIDCLQKIEREDTIASLSKLRKLTFGVYDFDRPGFMGIFASEQFKELNLLENRKRNFDLSPLAEFHGIETLLISGHWKGVEAITTLPKLDTLTLSSFPNRQNLMFLNKCHALRHLRLLLGSRNSIAEFSHAHLERFHVCWVRGLEDLGPIGRFPRLKELSIEDQLRVEQIDVSGSRVERMRLVNCKSLSSVIGIHEMTSLQELRVYRTALNLEVLRDMSWPPSLRSLGLYPTSQRKNDAMSAELARRGYKEGGLWLWA